MTYRVGFIGDIHGNVRELKIMIKRMEEHGIDRLISLGDLFDRGPDAHAAVRVIRLRGFKKRDGSRGNIEMVLGNHEDRNIRCHKMIPIPGRDRPPTPWSPREFNAMTDEDWDWLESLPFMIRIQEHGLDLCAVHGGFTEDMQSPGWGNFDYGGRMARVGWLSENSGKPLSPMGSSSRLWADEYDGRFGRVVYGHTTFSEIRYSDHAVGIDGSKRGKIFGIVISSTEEDVTFCEKIKGWLPPKPVTPSRVRYPSSRTYYYDEPRQDRFWSVEDFEDEEAFVGGGRYNDPDLEGFREFDPTEYEDTDDEGYIEEFEDLEIKGNKALFDFFKSLKRNKE